MGKSFDPRTSRRLEPKHAATAAMSADSRQFAYGVLTNVSVTGACIVTDSRLATGSEVELKLSFYQEPRLYEIATRVIWARRGKASEKGFEGLELYGVQFTLSSALEILRLHALLAGEDFVEVFRPSATEFDFLKSWLAGEVDQFDNTMHSTGE